MYFLPFAKQYKADFLIFLSFHFFAYLRSTLQKIELTPGKCLGCAIGQTDCHCEPSPYWLGRPPWPGVDVQLQILMISMNNVDYEVDLVVQAGLQLEKIQAQDIQRSQVDRSPPPRKVCHLLIEIHLSM